MTLIQIKHRLRPGSPLLRTMSWRAMPRIELKSLIQRFATKENDLFSKARRGAIRWRRKRLAAVAEYQSRFEPTPILFCKRKLPRLRSYYWLNDDYVWPARPKAIEVTISASDFAIGDETLASRAELAAALIKRHAHLVAFRMIGKPDYHQVEQACLAVRDAGARLGMTGAVGPFN